MGTTRDYYADLELPVTADDMEIKKQYRKLALKYHPDRNPGREQEVNTKFQIIQAAHEVLSDPTQKSKYDATLARAGRASGVKGNPWSNVGSQYPAPPRRAQATRPTPAPASGAQRWQSRFSAGVPPTAKQHQSTAEAEAKRNAARAFEGMRKPSTQPSSKTAERPPSSQAPPPPPRTETGRQRQQAAFGKSRSSAHHSKPPTYGEEPPVGSNYYPSKAHQTQAEYGADERIPDPLSQFRSKDPATDPRQSMPYTTHGGEKTSLFDGVPNRAKSQREPPPRDDRQESTRTRTSTEKHRSSSVPKAANGPEPGYVNIPDGRRPSTGEPNSPYDQTTVESRSRTKSQSGFAVPQQPASKAKQAGPTGAPDSRSSASGGAGPSMYAASFHMSQPFHYSQFLDLTKYANWNMAQNEPMRNATDRSKVQAPSGAPSLSRRLNAFEQQQHHLLDQLIRNVRHKKPKHTHQTNPKINCSLANQPAYSFGYSVNADGFTQPRPEKTSNGANRSVENINTQFTDDDPQSWQFQAEPGTSSSQQRSRPASRKGASSPLKTTATQSDTEASRDTERAHPSGFNAEGWSDKFGPQTFVPKPSVSPTKTSRPGGKKTKATKTTGSAAVIEDSSSGEEDIEWKGRSRTREAESPQAMDIDSPPTVGTSSSSSPAETGARNKSVEPSRAEWRSGDANINNVGSEDTEEFRTTFADFKKVEPFAPEQGTGLKSFNNMKDTLPFESQPASASKPPTLPTAPPLTFPTPPRAPVCPPFIAIDSIEATQEGAEKYIREFEAYLIEWDDFNAKVVEHFATRQAHIASKRSAEGCKLDQAQSEEYFVVLQQDNGVRTAWLRACEEHEARVRDFMVFKLKRA